MPKTKHNWDAIHDELERQGKFDEFTTPFNSEHTVPIDKNYVYLNRNIFFRALASFLRGVMRVFGPLVNAWAFGLKIEGRENLKAVKKIGAFSISNHIHYLDNLALRQAVGFSKQVYYTVAPHNCKSGLEGVILRAGGILPLPTDNIAANRNFNAAFKTLLEQDRLIHFYAERAMWMNYTKPRPFKKGAFRYAAKYHAPILPIYFTMMPSTGLRKLLGFKRRGVMRIMPPVFPKSEYTVKENADYLQQTVQRLFIEKYREVYGVTEENIYRIDPQYYDSLDEETKLCVDLSRQTASCATQNSHTALNESDPIAALSDDSRPSNP